MKNKDEKLRDFVVENVLISESVLEKIERRIEVLRIWLEDGIPEGKSFPRSLTQARLWEDLDSNITSIASPNEFTTTHTRHGRSVRDVAQLIDALKNRYDKPDSKSRKISKTVVEKFDRRRFDQQIEKAVSQWHEERDKHLQQKRRADSAEARSNLLLEENAQKDEQIADLKQKLLIHEGLRTVK